VVAPLDSSDCAPFVEREKNRWRCVIKVAGIKAEQKAVFYCIANGWETPAPCSGKRQGLQGCHCPMASTNRKGRRGASGVLRAAFSPPD